MNKLFDDLCYKDNRNPMYSDIYDEDDNPTPRVDCFCDNCFSGKDRIALVALALLKALKRNREAMKAVQEQHGNSTLILPDVCPHETTPHYEIYANQKLIDKIEGD